MRWAYLTDGHRREGDRPLSNCGRGLAILLLLHPLQGEMTGEGAATAEGALHFELGTVTLKNVFHDCEAEARAPR